MRCLGRIVCANVVKLFKLLDNLLPLDHGQHHHLSIRFFVRNELWMNHNHFLISMRLDEVRRGKRKPIVLFLLVAAFTATAIRRLIIRASLGGPVKSRGQLSGGVQAF